MPSGKQRHGCLTALLIVIIASNSVIGLIYLFASGTIRDRVPDAPGWAFPILTLFSFFNVVCAFALFRWKKWGFWGFVGSAIVALIVNMSIGLGVGTSLTGLVGVAVVYGVLQIGNGNKGWPQLD